MARVREDMAARFAGTSARPSKIWHKHPEVRKLIRAQTGLNVALNAIMPTTLLWLLRVPPPTRVVGIGGLLQALIVGVVIGTVVTFASTTKAVRRKLADGSVPVLRRGELHSVTRFLPIRDFGALLAIVALAVAIVLPPGLIVALVAHRLPLDRIEFAVLNALVGIVVGLWVAPRVVLHTLVARAQPTNKGTVIMSNPRAILYRMVLPEHTCPFGLRAKQMLEDAGYEIDERLLRSRDEVDALEDELGVDTTPQVFIEGERIGGSDDLAAYLSAR